MAHHHHDVCVAIHALSLPPPCVHTRSYSKHLLFLLSQERKGCCLTFFSFISGLDMDISFLIPSTFLKNYICDRSRFVALPINVSFDYRLHPWCLHLCTKVDNKRLFISEPNKQKQFHIYRIIKLLERLFLQLLFHSLKLQTLVSYLMTAVINRIFLCVMFKAIM